MENASKALIIAGAILLAILLISLGILVYNNAKGTVNDANLDEQEAQVFNEKFNQFLGTNKTTEDLKTMFSTIISSNKLEKNKLNRIIKVTYKAKLLDGENAAVSNKEPTTIPNISPNKTFTVKATYSNGCIIRVTIT